VKFRTGDYFQPTAALLKGVVGEDARIAEKRADPSGNPYGPSAS